MMDGYRRFEAFWKVVLPQATTGIAATVIFCLIFSWNEYAFVLLLTSGQAQTAPPFIPIVLGEGGLAWPGVAAGTTLFLLPVVVFTILLRQHLLRCITFGAVRKCARRSNERARCAASSGRGRGRTPRCYSSGPAR